MSPGPRSNVCTLASHPLATSAKGHPLSSETTDTVIPLFSKRSVAGKVGAGMGSRQLGQADDLVRSSCIKNLDESADSGKGYGAPRRRCSLANCEYLNHCLFFNNLEHLPRTALQLASSYCRRDNSGCARLFLISKGVAPPDDLFPNEREEAVRIFSQSSRGLRASASSSIQEYDSRSTPE